MTVGDLSPTLLDRYVSAAEKISRVAVGRPSRSPGGETIRIPADLTQEEHIEGLPIGTRGGALVRYTFPLDGEYEITIRLTRDRDELVEGLSEAHDLELLLDGERMQSFTVKPPKREPGLADTEQPSHEKVDQHLKVRLRASAGPHLVGVTFPKKPSAVLETAASALPDALQLLPPSTRPAGHLRHLDHRTVCRDGPRRHAQPPPDFRVTAGGSGRRSPLRQGDPCGADEKSLPAPGDGCRPGKARSSSTGKPERMETSTPASRWRCRPCW